MNENNYYNNQKASFKFVEENKDSHLISDKNKDVS